MASRTYNVKLVGIDDDIHQFARQRNNLNKLTEQILFSEELQNALYSTHLKVNGAVGILQDFIMSSLASVSPQNVEDAWLVDDEERRVKARRLATLFWFTVESKAGAPSSCFINDVQTLSDRLRELLSASGMVDADIDSWLEDVENLLNASIRDKEAVWVDRNMALNQMCEMLDWERNDEILFNSVVIPLFGSISELSKSGEGDRDFNQKTRSWSGCLRSGNKSDWSIVKSHWESLIEVNNRATSIEDFSDFFSKLDEEFNDTKKEPSYFDKLVGKLSGRASSGAIALEKLYSGGVFSDSIRDDMLERFKKSVDSSSSKSPLPPKILCDYIQQSLDEFGIPTGADDSGPIIDQACRRVGGWRSWLANQENDRWDQEEKSRKLTEVDDSIIDWLDKYRRIRGEDTGSIDEFQIHPKQLGEWKTVVEWWSKEPNADEPRRIKIVREVQAEDEGKFGDAYLFEAIAVDGAELLRADHKPLQKYVEAKEAEWKARRRKIPMMRHVDAHMHPVFIEYGNSRHTIKMNISEKKREKNMAALVKRITKNQETISDLEEKSEVNGLTEKQKQKLSKLKSDLSKDKSKLSLLIDGQGMVMRFFEDISWTDAEGAEQTSRAWNGHLRWAGERFRKEIAAGAPDFAKGMKDGENVPRRHRLGSAAAKKSQNQGEVQGYFAKEKANGRLVCVRRGLEKLASSNLSDKQRTRLIQNLKWRLAITTELEPDGPIIRYGVANNINVNLGKNKDGKPRFFLNNFQDENKKRGGKAKLRLSRLPSLRVLGVDLGHRKGASCAVWETLSTSQVQQLCESAGIICPTESDISFTVGKGKSRIHLRRIGANKLPDGTEHPAPWAKLERSFVIRLAGEDRVPRLASDEEIGLVHRLETEINYATPLIYRLVNSGFGSTDEQKLRIARWQSKEYWNGRHSGGGDKIRGRIDVLNLRRTLLRSIELSIRRHGDVARIAHDLGAADDTAELNREQAISRISTALARWILLIRSQKDSRSKNWQDRWPTNILGEIPEPPEREGRKTFRKFQDSLIPQADILYSNTSELEILRDAWNADWYEMDENWLGIIKEAVQWCRGKKHPGNSVAAERNAGGLSIDRITMIQDSRKMQIRFNQRPTPISLRANNPEKDDDSLREFGQRTLNSVNQMRDNRVKQLSSRIVEAALGLGVEPGRDDSGRQYPRALDSGSEQRHQPCHVVVMENLENYRPEQNKLRRENRGLMQWSSGKINDALSEQCELHGLKLEYVSPAYTSRLDGITGAPGIRVERLTLSNSINLPFWWSSRFEKAVKKADEGKASNYESFLADIQKSAARGELTSNSVILPSNGGTHFLSTLDSRDEAIALVDADINAARNIGIRVILDPDWDGSLHRIPAKFSKDSVQPLNENFKGSDSVSELVVARKDIEGDDGDSSQSGKVRNLHTRASNLPLQNRKYQLVKPYNDSVEKDCINILRRQLLE